MKTEYGVVVENDGNKARVKMGRHLDCSNCGSCSGDASLIIDALNPIGAKTGDSVVLQLDDSNIVKSAFIVYMLPVLFTAFGWGLGFSASLLFGFSVLSQLAGGVIFFLLSVFYIIRFDKSRRLVSKEPVIVQFADKKAV
jgi:sigma-E factor negative regulatory protein RseC